MNACMILLEKAIDLTMQEFEILDSEDMEGLEEHSQLREEVISRALSARMQADDRDFAHRLHELYELQAKLSEKAEARFNTLRDELKMQKQKTQLVSGYARLSVCHRGARYNALRKSL